jgi:hypothetical protein
MVVRLSALCTGRPSPPGIFLVLISVRGRVDPRAIVQLEELGKLKKSTSSGIRSRDLPACSIVPQPTTLPHTPKCCIVQQNSNNISEKTYRLQLQGQWNAKQETSMNQAASTTLTLNPWRWRQYAPPKHWMTHQNSVILQMTKLVITACYKLKGSHSQCDI